MTVKFIIGVFHKKLNLFIKLTACREIKKAKLHTDCPQNAKKYQYYSGPKNHKWGTILAGGCSPIFTPRILVVVVMVWSETDVVSCWFDRVLVLCGMLRYVVVLWCGLVQCGGFVWFSNVI